MFVLSGFQEKLRRDRFTYYSSKMLCFKQCEIHRQTNILQSKRIGERFPCNQPCGVIATDVRLLIEINVVRALMTKDVLLQVSVFPKTEPA